MDDVSPFTNKGLLTWLRVCAQGATRTYQLLQESSGALDSLATFSTGFPVGRATVDEGLIVVAVGSRICESLFSVQPRTIEPISILVVGPEASFDTGGDVRDECVAMGIADFPDLAGNRLAFLASTAAIGREGRERLDAPFDAYIVDTSVPGAASRVAVGVVHPSELAWLPDGSIAVSGDDPAGGGRTIRVDPATGAVETVLPFSVRSLALSEDGTLVAAIRTYDEALLSDEVIVFASDRLLRPLGELNTP